VRLIGRRAQYLLRRSRRTFLAIADCDLLIVKGGGWICGTGHVVADIITTFRLLYHALLAEALHKKYIMPGHTIYGIVTPYARKLLDRLVSGSIYTSTREDWSYNHLHQAHIDSPRLIKGVDLAFGINESPASRVTEILRAENIDPEATNIGVTIVYKPISLAAGLAGRRYAAYLKAMAHLIDALADEFDCEFYFMPQVLEMFSSHNDALAVAEVARLVRRKEKIHVSHGDYHPSELVGIYGRMKLFIASRLHSAILASITDVPVIAISYIGTKTQGIMEMMGLSEARFDIDDLDKARMLDLARAALRGEKSVWRLQHQRVSEIRARAKDEHSVMRKAYESNLSAGTIAGKSDV
jgi:polysaccharide pyruvyl transferase WcaK-like protein